MLTVPAFVCRGGPVRRGLTLGTATASAQAFWRGSTRGFLLSGIVFAEVGAPGLFGSWGTTVASAVYLVVLVIELFGWPKRRDQLLANTDRSADITGPV